MDISVIIPTHNRADALEKTLEHLARQDFAGEWETIIADNNSTEDIEAVVERWQPKFPTSISLVHETVPGAAATRNAGAKRAAGEYLLFLDNDILTEPDFLSRHLSALKQNPNSWMTGAVVNLPEQERTVFGRYRQTLFPMPAANEPAREITGISAQNFSLPRRHFEQLNGFDVNFYSGEDFELAMRGREKLGVTTMLDPGIVTLHNDWAGWTFADFARASIRGRNFIFGKNTATGIRARSWSEKICPPIGERMPRRCFCVKSLSVF